MPPKIACPANEPLVRALRQKARGQYSGTHMARTLTKATKSICKFPLPLASGEEAMQLENVGAWVADQIREILDAVGSSNTDDDDVNAAAGQCSPPKRRRTQAPAQVPSQGTAELRAVGMDGAAEGGRYAQDGISQTMPPSPALAERRQPQAKASANTGAKKPKAYIPKTRSGNWAVVIALAENTVNPHAPAAAAFAATTTRTSLLKSELVGHNRINSAPSSHPPSSTCTCPVSRHLVVVRRTVLD